MVTLAKFQTPDQSFRLLQDSWSSALNPILSNPYLNGLLLDDVSLMTGTNVINHTLGRKQQGWVLVDRNGTANVYRSAAFNNLTLTLTASAPVTVSIYVF